MRSTVDLHGFLDFLVGLRTTPTSLSPVVIPDPDRPPRTVDTGVHGDRCQLTTAACAAAPHKNTSVLAVVCESLWQGNIA